MAFGSVSPLQPQDAAAAGHHHHHGRHKQVLDSVAKTLDMDEQDVASALESGKSLSQLASEKGVSQDDLVKSIEQGLGQAGAKIDRESRPRLGSAAAVDRSGASAGRSSVSVFA